MRDSRCWAFSGSRPSVNSGAWSGDGGWSKDTTGPVIDSINPATGEMLAQVRSATAADYERVMRFARRGVRRSGAWCPRRSAARPCACSARRCARTRSDLGSAGHARERQDQGRGRLGEVQEMIDIADFAVGQSRMLYGLTMHSERPQHRMYEQWHPLGVVGIISRVQLPGRGVGVECVPRRDLRRRLGLEAVAEDAADARSPSSTSCNRVMRARKAAGDLPAVHRCRHRAGGAVRRRPPRRAGVVHRLDRRRPQGRRARRARGSARACSSSAATTRSSSMSPRTSNLAVPADRVRRGRHRRPALHDARAACSCIESRIDGARAAAGACLRAGAIGNPLDRRRSWAR